jgi:hypothetical protein
LYPNPTSEAAPLEGQNPAAVDWVNRYNAGGSAYAGTHVRQLVTVAGGGQYQEAAPVIVQCVPGERFTFRAMLSERTAANANTKGYIYARFYNAAGADLGATPDALDIQHIGGTTWTALSVTTAAAPAGSVTVRATYGIDCTAGVVVGETYWWDALLLKRVAAGKAVGLDDFTSSVSWQAPWTDAGGTRLFKVGDVVFLSLTALGTALAGSVAAVLPVGCRPASGTYPTVCGVSSAGATMRVHVTSAGQVGVSGTIAATEYDALLCFPAAG